MNMIYRLSSQVEKKHTPEMWSENKPIKSFKKLITLL